MAKKGKKKMENEVIEPVEEVVEEPVEEVVEEPVEEVEEIIEPEVKEGIVGGCIKLNVRSEASIDSSVVCVLDADTKVTIYPEDSNDNFYKIRTADGLDGYCKTAFIWINQED